MSENGGSKVPGPTALYVSMLKGEISGEEYAEQKMRGLDIAPEEEPAAHPTPLSDLLALTASIADAAEASIMGNAFNARHLESDIKRFRSDFQFSGIDGDMVDLAYEARLKADGGSE